MKKFVVPNPGMPNLWIRCMLEGDALDEAVALHLGWHTYPDDVEGKLNWYDANKKWKCNKSAFKPSSDWASGGPIIESNQIFLSPPRNLHIYGGPNHGWHDYPWQATVSSRVRFYKNEAGHECVGRGQADKPLVAAMRAFVASFGGAS